MHSLAELDGLVIPGVHLTPLGLDLPEDLPFDEWESIGRRLQRVNAAMQWLIGDWIRFGENHYGEMYAQAIQETGRDDGSLRNMVYVASRFDVSRRRDSLPYAHHSEVASLPAPEADLLLDLAEKHEWNRQELRQAVSGYKVEKQRQEQILLSPPVVHTPRVRIERADARNLPLEDGSVQLIVTSPPYNLGKDYPASADDAGYSEYLATVAGWAQEMFRVAGPQGRACINVPLDTNKGGKRAIYADYVRLFRFAGWNYQTSIVWNEQNISRRTAWGSWCMPSAPFVTAPVEMIMVVHKGDWKLPINERISDIAAAEFKDWTLGMWTFPGENPKRVGHPSAFPEELPYRLIRLYSWPTDIVLDPFCGSGTTGAVALQLGRSFYGFDIAPEYVEKTIARVGAQSGGVAA